MIHQISIEVRESSGVSCMPPNGNGVSHTRSQAGHANQLVQHTSQAPLFAARVACRLHAELDALVQLELSLPPTCTFSGYSSFTRLLRMYFNPARVNKRAYSDVL